MATSVSRIRRWLSYVWEQRLETTSSPYNEYLEVCLVHGRLQLVAEEAIYSFGDYYLNFRKIFEEFDFSRLPERAEVLVLGLGLGSIPELLEKHIGLDYRYVAVEIDPIIIDLASRYSLPDLDSPIEVVQADAQAYLTVREDTYDLICVDVFQDADVPEHLDNTGFCELLSRRLNPGGAVIFNRLASTLEDRVAARQFYEEIFLTVFPDGRLFDSGGNYLLVNKALFLP